MYNTNTALGRVNMLIEKRKDNITLYRSILNGTCEQYKNVMLDKKQVENALTLEQDLLKDLLIGEDTKQLILQENADTLMDYCYCEIAL